MGALHERFLAEVNEERGRLRSRRGLLKGGAKFAGGGALALAVAGTPGSRALRIAAAQDFTDDLDILNYALTLEHLEYAFYRDGLDAFREDAFAELFEDDESADDADDATEEAGEADDDAGERGEPTSVRVALEAIRDHEEAHVQALTDTITQLGGTPVAEAEYDFGYGDDLEAFLEIARALENTGVAAYAGAAPFITDAAILAAALGIHSVEARHAAYLNLQNGASSFPDAVDSALTRDEVLAIAGPFIVTAGGATSTAPAASTAAPDDGVAATEAPAPAPTEEPAPAPTDEPVPEPTEEPAPAPTDEPVEQRTPEPRTPAPRTPETDETPEA